MDMEKGRSPLQTRVSASRITAALSAVIGTTTHPPVGVRIPGAESLAAKTIGSTETQARHARRAPPPP
jgi:hypothetical protein